MSRLSIGIAGGGIGGMTAALLLAGDGHAVTLHERSSRLGGRLRYEQFGRFRIDQGPTIVLLPELLLGLLEEAGVRLDRLELLPCDPMYRIHYGDGAVFEKWSDPERQLAEIARLFPGEENGFRRYMRDHDRAFPEGKRAFLDRPFLHARRALTPQSVRLLLRMRAYRSVRARAASYFRDPRLIDAFSLQTLYIGGGPHRTPALYGFIPYAEHRYGVWYLKGGYAGLVAELSAALERRGVTVKLGSEVTGIRVADGRARGLETADGFEPYDAVVFNGEAPLLPKLLPAHVRAPKRRFTPSSGCLLLYIGASRRWPEAAVHQFVLPADFDAGMRRLFAEGVIPEQPSYYLFNPAAIDPESAPSGESALYLMIPAPPANAPMWAESDIKQRIDALLDAVLADAERKLLPGLRSAIVERKVRTPFDAEAIGLYQGGSFGIAPTAAQSGPLRPQLKPLPIERLYAVGASTHPGGGVPIVMQGAKLLAEHIRKEMYS
ncbi:phytoene desaturase [Paenibacillus athensensis]|uniref:Phytoene desaturase n=1 Tax=Paenibacillus athensensis TaxID=1967502 RepID=A0A4Y8Q1X7_9BACL|nr:phytoene desaturase family protein [Paenibacillus athensensis]MCD1261029.1 phytoene desaturase [Paenibacillus athensensis]